MRKRRGNGELPDRFLISAFIEARFCERFKVLARWCADRELARFYACLSSSELGHQSGLPSRCIHAGQPSESESIRDLFGHPIKELIRNLAAMS